METNWQWECDSCNWSHWGFRKLFQRLHGAYRWRKQSHETLLYSHPRVGKRNNVVSKWNVLVWKYCNANHGVEDVTDFPHLPTQFLEIWITGIPWQIGQEKCSIKCPYTRENEKSRLSTNNVLPINYSKLIFYFVVL